MLPFLGVLIVTTLVLGYIFFIFENEAQPKEYPDILKAFAWASFNYIGDSGNFGGSGPITIEGRIISTIVSIIKILIIAVPAGLLSNGYKKAREEEKERERLEECKRVLVMAFRRKEVKELYYRVVPRRIPIKTLIVKKGVLEADIIKTVIQNKEFRMRNLASSQPTKDYPVDRWAVELLPLDEYTVDGIPIQRYGIGEQHSLTGIYIDRQSPVTIIAPTAASENSIGFFAYYLAQFGGFNYISKEFEMDVNSPMSFFNITDDDKVKPFIKQIKDLNKGNVKWNVVIISSESIHDSQFHFIHKYENEGKQKSTIQDDASFKTFSENFSNEMKTTFNYTSDLDSDYYKQKSNNITVKVGGGTDTNAFTLRIAYSVTTWSNRPTPIITTMAKIIKNFLGDPSKNLNEESWKEKGFGFGKEKTQDY